MSWYVVQTLKGREKRVADEIKEKVAGENETVFIFENEMQYKVKGEWKKDRKPFFPGYIFVELEIDKAGEFNWRLRKKKLKLLETDGVVTPIKPEEQDYLMRLGGEEHVIRHSEGFRLDDMVEITSGSFKGYKGEIRKLDRHNRRAKVCVPFMGEEIEVEIGLEIVTNSTFQELENKEKIDRLNMAKVVTA